MIPEYVQEIKDWPVPESGKEVATFLGFAGYYPTFLPQYSALTNRLKGINKAEKLLWNKEIERDFVELKRAFTEGGIQAFPDFEVGDLVALDIIIGYFRPNKYLNSFHGLIIIEPSDSSFIYI